VSKSTRQRAGGPERDANWEVESAAIWAASSRESGRSEGPREVCWRVEVWGGGCCWGGRLGRELMFIRVVVVRLLLLVVVVVGDGRCDIGVKDDEFWSIISTIDT